MDEKAFHPPGRGFFSQYAESPSLLEENESFGEIDAPRLIFESGAVETRLAKIVTPVLLELGCRLVWVSLFRLGGGLTLQIMIERADGTMSVDLCAEASHALSPLLDLEDPISEPYDLEISSPGVDRLLVRLSDFMQAQDLSIKLDFSELYEGRRRLKGDLRKVEKERILLCPGRFSEVKGGRNQRNAKKVKEEAQASEAACLWVPFTVIQKAKLVLTPALLKRTENKTIEE